MKRIDWKRLARKVAEDAPKKFIETLILVIVLGLTLKTVMAAVPAITVASVFAKIVKVRMFD